MATKIYGGRGRAALRGIVCALVTAVAVCATKQPSAAYDVMLRWTQPPETDMAGYRLYIGTAPRTYAPGLDLRLLAASTFNGVVYYVLRNVDSSGIDTYLAVTAYNYEAMESGYSNEKTLSLVNPTAPVANAGSDQTGPAGASFMLGVAASSGVSYFWEQVSGVTTAIALRTQSTAQVTPSTAGVYVFQVAAYNSCLLYTSPSPRDS